MYQFGELAALRSISQKKKEKQNKVKTFVLKKMHKSKNKTGKDVDCDCVMFHAKNRTT